LLRPRATLFIQIGQQLLSAVQVGSVQKKRPFPLYAHQILALTNENKAKSGLENVEFLKGEIEHMTLPDNAVDVIISNCVINLSADKDKVFAEAFRILKPGGRFAVSDVVVNGEVPAEIRKNMELWIGCIAGALEKTEFEAKLKGAGFTNISIEPTRIYKPEDAREFLASSGLDVDKMSAAVENKFMSCFVRATKTGLNA